MRAHGQPLLLPRSIVAYFQVKYEDAPPFVLVGGNLIAYFLAAELYVVDVGQVITKL